MTLVQNLRQLLNGNNLGLLLVIFLAFSSCDAFRKAQTDDDEVTENRDRDNLDEIQGDRVYNPKTGKYEYTTSVTEKMDTVKWTVTDPAKAPPITSEATEATRPNGGTTIDPGTGEPVVDGPSEKLSSYNVAMLLPFYSSRFGDGSSVSRVSIPALEFYGGSKMAFDELGSEGINLNVTVHDSKRSANAVSALMTEEALKNAHLVIGPFAKDNIITAAEAAKTNRTPLISPISPSSNVTRDNPYFIQVSPYLQTHCESILQHARKQYREDQIVLLVRNKQAEISRLKYFHAENDQINATDNGPRLKEYIVTDQTADLSEMDLSTYIQEGDTTVFIVPSWSNESFIYSLLRNIEVARGKNPVVVYGMPQWMKYERISYDYYEKLNLHVSSSSFVDSESSEVQDFQRRYFDRYGTIPGNEAYVGYDVTLFFGRMLAKHGTKFQERIDAEDTRYLHTRFKFIREIPLSAALDEDFEKTNLFENKYVNILRFKDYRFQLAEE